MQKLYDENLFCYQILKQADFVRKEMESVYKSLNENDKKEYKKRLQQIYRIKNNTFCLLIRNGFKCNRLGEDLVMSINGDRFVCKEAAIKTIFQKEYDSLNFIEKSEEAECVAAMGSTESNQDKTKEVEKSKTETDDSQKQELSEKTNSKIQNAESTANNNESNKPDMETKDEDRITEKHEGIKENKAITESENIQPNTTENEINIVEVPKEPVEDDPPTQEDNLKEETGQESISFELERLAAKLKDEKNVKENNAKEINEKESDLKETEKCEPQPKQEKSQVAEYLEDQEEQEAPKAKLIYPNDTDAKKAKKELIMDIYTLTMKTPQPKETQQKIRRRHNEPQPKAEIQTEQIELRVLPLSIPVEEEELSTEILVYVKTTTGDGVFASSKEGRKSINVETDKYAFVVRGEWKHGEFHSSVYAAGETLAEKYELNRNLREIRPDDIEKAKLGHPLVYVRDEYEEDGEEKETVFKIHAIPLRMRNSENGACNSVFYMELPENKNTSYISTEKGYIVYKVDEEIYKISAKWENGMYIVENEHLV